MVCEGWAGVEGVAGASRNPTISDDAVAGTPREVRSSGFAAASFELTRGAAPIGGNGRRHRGTGLGGIAGTTLTHLHATAPVYRFESQ